MDRTQRRILWLLIAIGAIYFITFIFPNSTGAKTYSMISLFSPDEHIQYPTALFMLSGDGLKDVLHHFILYGDYSYGFPFYGGSALVLLPLQIDQRTQQPKRSIGNVAPASIHQRFAHDAGNSADGLHTNQVSFISHIHCHIGIPAVHFRSRPE